MKNLLRYGLTGVLIFLLVLLLSPLLFKGKIQQLVTKTVNENINGSFSVENIGLSFITRFPNAHIYIEDFTLTGIDEFEGDTLAQAERLDLVVNLFSVFGKDGISIKKVQAQKPSIHAIMLENGKANWDVAMVDTTTATESSEPASYKLNLNSYEITQGRILYEDELTPMKLWVENLDHEGSGAFTEIEYDLQTLTKAGSVTVDYQGVEYLSNTVLDAEVDMHIDMSKDISVELMDNVIRVNDLGVRVDGTTVVGTETIDLDLNFAATEASTVKSIFSLIPGAYTQDFDQVETGGTLTFKGAVKGVYSEKQLPGFDLSLEVDDGEVNYPDLPQAITAINLDLSVRNPDGDLEKTEINISQFDALMGDNPLHVRAEIKGLENMFVNGEMEGRLDLGKLAQVIPLEGNELKGIFEIEAEANGYYNEATGTFPEVNARMNMKDGYVKSADYPEAELKDIFFDASLSDVDGKMNSAVFEMPDFSFELGGEEIVGALLVRDFNDPYYDLRASGKLDLDKLMKIYPIEGMDLSGVVDVKNLVTQGRLSDIEAERYDRLPTSGEVTVSNILYASPEVAHPVFINNGHASFTPQRLEIDNVEGKAGQTDFNINGFLENYLGYVLMGNDQITGTWILKSNIVNINEWMTNAPSPDSVNQNPDAEPYGVVPVPAGVNMLVQADIGQILYQNLTLNDMEGILTVANEEVAMEGLAFGMLGGQVAMRGNYETRDIDNPGFALDLDIDRMGFSSAVQNLVLVDRFAPVARLIDGFFNTQLSMKGSLDENMYPVLEKITSKGIFEVLEGKITDLPLLTRIADRTKLQNIADLTLDHVKGQFSIRDGSVFLEPISLTKNDLQMVFVGSQNISGSMDYQVKLTMPRGSAGDAVFAALPNVLGGAVADQDSISLLLSIGGTLKDPQITGIQSETATRVKDQLVNKAEEKLQEKIGRDVNIETDSLKAEIEKAKQAGKDTLISAIEEKKQQAKDSLENLVGEESEDIKEEIDKALEEKIGKEGKDKLNELKNKFGLPIKKNKQNNDS